MKVTGPNRFCLHRRTAAAVLGVPPVWRLYHPDLHNAYVTEPPEAFWLQLNGDHMDLMDLQTAAWFAWRLDEYEATASPLWATRLAYAQRGSPQHHEALIEMIARIEYISLTDQE